MTRQFIPPRPGEIETLLNSARPSLAPLTNLTEARADTLVMRFTIEQLNRETYSRLELDAETQGTLVRANYRLARKLRRMLREMDG